MTPRSAILASIVAIALGACGPAEVRGTAYYETTPYDGGYVAPGVTVVAGDYDDPVFYSYDDGLYWRYYDGVWYRSTVAYGGWISVGHVPYTIARIDRPWRYAHATATWGPRPVYRPGYRPVYRPADRPVPRALRGPGRPIIRDHRR